VRESKVATEPQAIIAFLSSIGLEYTRIGLEAGPLSPWLVNGLAEAELPVICVETRHMKAVLKAQQVNKSDRNDARGIAQMMRVELYKPVHVKTLASQQARMQLNQPQAIARQAAGLGKRAARDVAQFRAQGRAVRWYYHYGVGYRDLEQMYGRTRRLGRPLDDFPMDPAVRSGDREALTLSVAPAAFAVRHAFGLGASALAEAVQFVSEGIKLEAA
jgi:hypothetical protein